VFLLDSLLIGGLRFVLDKIAAAAEAELDDEARLKERLLEAQMRVETGELTEADYRAIERDVIARLRDLHARRGEPAAGPGPYRVVDVEADLDRP